MRTMHVGFNFADSDTFRLFQMKHSLDQITIANDVDLLDTLFQFCFKADKKIYYTYEGDSIVASIYKEDLV